MLECCLVVLADLVDLVVLADLDWSGCSGLIWLICIDLH